MDSSVGLDYIMESTDYTQKLATALDTDDIPVKKQVFELLSALCVYRPDGYTRALETLEHYKDLKKQRYRFQLIVDEMRSSEVAEYTTALVAFLNCLVISPTSLNDRIRIRNEFLGLKILDVLNRFRKQCKEGSNSDLSVQLDVFDEQRSTDEGQFSGPDGVDLSSHMDVFFAILRQVAETPLEVPFLSILQHLLRTDLNQPLSDIVWETAETLVHRATLLESKQEADRLLRASNLGGLVRCLCSCHYRQNGLEECDASSPVKKNRPNQLSFCSSDGMRTPTLLLSPNQNGPPPTPHGLAVSSPTVPPTSTDMIRPLCKVNFQKPQSNFNNTLLDNISSQCDKSPLCTNASTLNSSSNFKLIDCDKVAFDNCSKDSSSFPRKADTCTIPPPPPPPPPMNVGGGPPPPPPPPPIPQRLTSEAKKAPVPVTLPQQDTPKPKAKMKSFNWSKIPVSKVLGKDNLWSRVAKDHSGSTNDLDFDAMERLFCQQAIITNGHSSPKFGDSPEVSDRKKKEIQEINLLDGKRSLNINIFLKQFRSSHESIVRILEDGSHEALGAERLRGLLKILPETDEIELLRNFDGDRSRLGNAEKFLQQLIEVPSFKLRIESMLLKEEFMANQEFLENSIETIRCGVQELEECKRLHEILYMVLVAGNFLNAGGYAGNAAGFKMLSLLKLTDIRANKPSMTLIHYVAEQVFQKRPDLLEFLGEVQNLEEASKISMETLKTDVSSLCQRVSRVSTQVAVAEDQIRSQMQDFLEFAESKVETIQNEINNLDILRLRLGEFLCEDTSTFKLEDCFKVFHNFCTRFKSALQENEKRYKQEKLAEARRKQRELQIALKRRSLELSDYRHGTDSDHIMDQLLGDIRSGFPERQLGDIYRRSRRSYDPTENGDTSNTDKDKLQTALKRHSDPAMLQKCVENGNYPDDKNGTFKSRRARFLDGEDILDFLQNPKMLDSDLKDRPFFGSAEDSLEKSSIRRSGRRKRIEQLINGESQSRERTGSSPPPVNDISETKAKPQIRNEETTSKQRLKAKINEWMVQNEREQKRDVELQLKLLQERKKRQVNGLTLSNGDIMNGESHILEESEEIVAKQLSETKRDVQSSQNGSFTQKIIGLLNASSSETKPFEKTRLYHSTKEKRSLKEELNTKAKDDSQIYTLTEVQNPSASLTLNSDKELEGVEKTKSLVSNFDRFAITRKTQRRLKLREMRIEAENVKVVNPEVKTVIGNANTPLNFKANDKERTHIEGTNGTKNIEEKEISLVDNNCTSFTTSDSSTEESLSTLSEVSPQEKECVEEIPDMQPRTEDTNLSNEFSSNNPESNKDSFCQYRQRNSSLRSRQSRLARRINSLSTPISSPEHVESNPLAFEYENFFPEELVIKNNHETAPILQAAINGQSPGNDSSLQTSQLRTQHQISLNESPTDAGNSGSEKSKPKNLPKDKEKLPKEGSSKQPSGYIPEGNGQLSHKVTVTTETKSRVILPKPATNRQISRPSTSSVKPRAQSQSSTSIPTVIKTTQNVKVQQTINKQSNSNSTTRNPPEINAKRGGLSQPKNNLPKSSPIPSPPVPRKGNEQKGPAIVSGKVSNLRNGKTSPSSSISSMCSLSTNVKLVRNEKVTNGKPANAGNSKKITINHNGSVRFVKETNSANKNNQRATNASVISPTIKTEKTHLSTRKKPFI